MTHFRCFFLLFLKKGPEFALDKLCRNAIFCFRPETKKLQFRYPELESLIPASKISTLTQGMFVGAVADNFNERIGQKIFHCEIVVDAEKVKREEQAYKPIPVITDFTDADGNDRMKEMIQENYNRIRAEVRQIVADELQRIQSDPELQHLLQNK